MLSYQLPNAKKLRRIAQKAEHLAAKGIVPRRQKKLLNLRAPEKTESKAVTDANNNPERDFYDIWAPESEFSVYLCVCVSSDDCILALTVFPSWECEDKHGVQVIVV